MNRLKELRKDKKITQSDLSNATGIPLPTLRRWEQQNTPIKQEKAQLLADYFGVSVGYLLGYSDEVGLSPYEKIFNELTDNLKSKERLSFEFFLITTGYILSENQIETILKLIHSDFKTNYEHIKAVKQGDFDTLKKWFPFSFDETYSNLDELIKMKKIVLETLELLDNLINKLK